MKIKDIYESTTAGSIATVAAPMATQKRSNVGKGVYGNEKAGNLLTGKKTNKKFANSVNESKMKELAIDIKNMDNGNFQKKYKMSKDYFIRKLGDPNKMPVQEAQLEEDDLIIVPGQGRKMRTGFIPHGQSRIDHEVEMARSDLFSAAKNAKQVYELIADLTEEEGLEGWVQEKIIKANDYLNTIREYLEGKQLQSEMTGGVIAGGGVGESKKDMIDLTPHLDNLEKAMNSMIAQGDREDKYPSYRRKMIDKRYELEKAGFPKGGIKKAPGLTKTIKPGGGEG